MIACFKPQFFLNCSHFLKWIIIFRKVSVRKMSVVLMSLNRWPVTILGDFRVWSGPVGWFCHPDTKIKRTHRDFKLKPRETRRQWESAPGQAVRKAIKTLRSRHPAQVGRGNDVSPWWCRWRVTSPRPKRRPLSRVIGHNQDSSAEALCDISAPHQNLLARPKNTIYF